MDTPSSPRLLTRPGFGAFFVTQLLSAFNDNFFKNAVVIWISVTQAQLFGLSAQTMIAACSFVFILPFLVLSASAGQLADRYEKPRLMVWIKAAEVVIMGLAAIGFAIGSLSLLLSAVFLMGVHSAFLGPIKYSILPQLVAPGELVAANALVEMGTFLAILVGTLGGGLLVLLPSAPLLLTGVLLGSAIIGLLASMRVPKLPAVAPELRVRWNPVTPTREVLSITRRTRAVFLAALGISWFWFFGAALLTLLPVYARDTLGAHERVVTAFLALFCLGIALGSVLCEKISGKNLELGLVPLGSLGISLFMLDLFFVGAPAHITHAPLGIAAFLQQPGSVRISCDLFGIALCAGFYTVPLYTLLQQRAEAKERARVVAGNNVLNALFMLAASGLLAVLFELRLSLPAIFLLLAALNAAVAVYICGLLPEFMLRFCAFVLSRVMYRLRCTGVERVPEHGAALLVCNHVSFVDWLLIAGAIRRPIRFVMDHRIAAMPLVSWLLRHGKTIPIAPEREDKALMERAFARIAEELRAGELVCIFPEGRLTQSGELGEFRGGVSRIVRETGVQVVPMALSGLWGSLFSRKDGPALRKWPRRFRARVQLAIGEAVPARDASPLVLRDRVQELLSQDAPRPSGSVVEAES